jgi:L-asparaginase
VAHVSTVSLFSKPSPHLTFADLLVLRDRTAGLLRDYDGAVITHGTDTLEETAYFLDLTLDGAKPVVVTGAMRHSSLPSADGPGNLFASVLTAACDGAAGQGVLVCLNDEVHAARAVTKAHSTNVHAFRSPGSGPVGSIYAGSVHWHRTVTRCAPVPIRSASARVGLIKAAIGVDSLFFRAGVEAGFQGFVLEALGGGHVPDVMLPGIELAIERGLPVVMVSRCAMGGGLLRSTYGTVGSEMHLREMGVIWADSLNGQKARVKLVVALGSSSDLPAIRRYFEDPSARA